MHSLNFFVFLAAISVWPLSRVLTTWIKARHGYPLDRAGRRRNERGETDLPVSRQQELLSAENERLTSQVSRLEERIAVLERIATDPAERTAREIEALR
ncbi:MAG: hypothetical protein K2P79_03520 [Sphingomonas sp.]|nr:hypothetical protein [Sphingomonas sp.]